MRQLRNWIHRWRALLVACFVTYILILYLPIHKTQKETTVNRAERVKLPLDAFGQLDVDKVGIFPKESNLPIDERIKELNARDGLPQPGQPMQIEQEVKEEESEGFLFAPVGKDPFYVLDVMTNYHIPLKEKFNCEASKTEGAKILLSWNAGHGQEHLGGCPDWNCVITSDRSKVNRADAVMIAYDDRTFIRRPDQYVIYFSQESPANAGIHPETEDYFNMSLGFRHDSPAASPYGYTVKLAKKSWKQGELISPKLVEGKSKAAAWYVSHCSTNSRRELIVTELQKELEVDIYGSCGDHSCPRNGNCENALDTDYHFYIAFENSICKDYLTEKLWNQGYGRDIIPVVLSRSLTAPFVPPNSFLAVDDYKTTQEMASHMKYLMKNSTAYMEYFAWRREYKVVFLNGKHHDVLERPWGFCQVCRMMWAKERKRYSIPKFSEYWGQSCEVDATLANKILVPSKAAKKKTS